MKVIHCLYLTLFGVSHFAMADTLAKPNFVIILVDDLGYGDIAPFGSRLNRTPNLDRMAAEGMKLTSFYGAPVCSSSRAQILTGCYSKRIGINGALPPVCRVGLSAEEMTVAEMLKAQGYSTMMIGKWHLGDQAEFLPTRHGFDHYLGIPYSNDMGGSRKAAKPIPGDKNDNRPPLPLLRDDEVIEAPVDQDHLTARYTDEAVKFIAANKERPFFLYLAHAAVHVPLHPGAAFKGKSANGLYGDWVEETDWSVGRVLDALKQMNLDKNTLVFFTSDNGPWLSKGVNGGVAAPLRGGKFSCWEGGIRAPAIAWWPGKIQAGSVCDAVMSEIDVLPTTARLAGGEVPTDRVIDGKDIWPLLASQSKESPHEALFYWEGMALAAVRVGEWKLLVRPQEEPGRNRDAVVDFVPQLYHLDKDMGETTDLAARHPDVVRRLQERIADISKDLGIKGSKAPGVRAAGHVANPKPLLMRNGMEYD